jgi:hypothetical protein
MWNEGLGAGTYQLYCDAEREIEAIAAVRANSGPWTLSENASSILKKVVCIYDVALSGISAGRFTRCHAKLERLLGMLVVRSGEALLQYEQTRSVDTTSGE